MCARGWEGDLDFFNHWCLLQKPKGRKQQTPTTTTTTQQEGGLVSWELIWLCAFLYFLSFSFLFLSLYCCLMHTHKRAQREKRDLGAGWLAGWKYVHFMLLISRFTSSSHPPT